MAKQKELNSLDKKGWVSSFNLVGRVKLNNNTFQIDARSQKSDWVYSRMNLAVDCGSISGVSYASLMAGYAENRPNVIYKSVPQDGGGNETIEIDWDDRFDDDIIKKVPDYQLITVGIEKDNKGKTYYKKFLSGYDAIAYLNESLQDGAIVNVRGNVQYRVYNGTVQADRNITSIALSSATEDKFRANFTQTVLIGEDCLDSRPDKEKGTIGVSGYVLEKLKEYNGYDLTQNGKIKGGEYVPMMENFEYKYPDDPDKMKKAITYLFKIKRGTISEITFDGYYVNGGAAVEATYDDLPDDLRSLIAIGVLTEEDALASVAINAPRVHRMVFTKPRIKTTTNADGTTTATPQIFKEKYNAEDIDDLYFMHEKQEVDMNPPEDEETATEADDSSDDSGDDQSWLDDLKAE